MIKYRLNIKYPIDENDVRLMADNGKSLCWAYDNNNIESQDKLSFFGFPESWIEEIKEESEFVKWYRDNIEKFTHNGQARLIADQSWKASQENRDLLYKPLIESLTSTMNANGLSANVIKHLMDIDKTMQHE